MDLPKFRNLVKNKVTYSCISYLKKIQVSHSKIKDIQYTATKIQPYLVSPKVSDNLRRVIFQVRSRMFADIRSNFKRQFVDYNCPLKCNHIDSQEKILICDKLKDNFLDLEYSDLFKDIHKQEAIAKAFNKAMKIRENMIEEIIILKAR